jgi:hypothetical protein
MFSPDILLGWPITAALPPGLLPDEIPLTLACSFLLPFSRAFPGKVRAATQKGKFCVSTHKKAG